MQNQCRSSLHFLRIDRPSADAPWLGRGLQNLAARSGSRRYECRASSSSARRPTRGHREAAGPHYRHGAPSAHTRQCDARDDRPGSVKQRQLIGGTDRHLLEVRPWPSAAACARVQRLPAAELVSCAVDTGATQTLRASHARPPSTAFGFGRDRERWEEVFTDAAMTELNDRLFACRRRYGKMCVARWSRRWCPASSKAPAGPSRNC